MPSLIKFLKTIRNNWKKSTFAFVAVSYATVYTKEYYETQNLMREYCKKAAKYGNETLSPDSDPKKITIILNPNANKRKAMKQFEKYCAPILHLSGFCVDIVQTESEGHAKTLAANLPETDALVVAGGDGTLSEVITGVLRSNESNTSKLPIGVLPLGRNNTIGKHFFPGGDHLRDVRSLADACMAVIEEHTKSIDVLKIEVLDADSEEVKKPIYALSGLEWGAYRDAHVKKDKYWYFGPLRDYVTYLINGFKDSLSWRCDAVINYSPPCKGCANCFETTTATNNNKGWLLRFLSNQNKEEKPLTVNVNCMKKHEKNISSSNLRLMSGNISDYSDESTDEVSKLQLKVGPLQDDYFDFVTTGWEFEKSRRLPVRHIIEARQIEIHPVVKKEQWFSIDNEDFEVKPIRVTLLPKLIRMFVKNQNANV